MCVCVCVYVCVCVCVELSSVFNIYYDIMWLFAGFFLWSVCLLEVEGYGY